MRKDLAEYKLNQDYGWILIDNEQKEIFSGLALQEGENVLPLSIEDGNLMIVNGITIYLNQSDAIRQSKQYERYNEPSFVCSVTIPKSAKVIVYENECYSDKLIF